MSGDEALSATVSLGVPLDVVLTVSVMLKHVVQLFHCESPVPKMRSVVVVAWCASCCHCRKNRSRVMT